MLSILLLIGVNVLMYGSLYLRHFLRRTRCADAAYAASIILLAVWLVATGGAACAGEIPGPAALAPMPAAPFVRPWWLDALASVLPELIQSAAVGVLFIAGWLLKRAASVKGLEADAEVRTYLLDGGQRAMALAYKAAGVAPGASLSEAQLTRILDKGVAYMAARFPDGLRRLGVGTDADLRGLIEGIQADYEARARRPPASAQGVRLPVAVDKMITDAPRRWVPPDITGVYRPEDGPHAGPAADER